MALLQPEERERIAGLVINKFRGDLEILRPGLSLLEEKTGKRVLGVVPYLKVDVDDEDSLAPRLGREDVHKPLDAAVIRLPRISNFTDFAPLEEHPQIGVRYVDDPRKLGSPDLVVLPGTKSTGGDLLWLRQNGLEAAILKLAAAGTPVLGVCGGYQMLGEAVHDRSGVEHGAGGSIRGMGLLPVETTFLPEKTRTRVRGETASGPLAGARLEGYEIHMGSTQVRGEPFCRLEDGREDGCVRGSVWGTYLHGLFDSGELTQKLAELLCRRKGLRAESARAVSHAAYQQGQLDLLADGVRQALDMREIYRIMGMS